MFFYEKASNTEWWERRLKKPSLRYIFWNAVHVTPMEVNSGMVTPVDSQLKTESVLLSNLKR